MSLGTSNRDGGKTSESGHLRALAKVVSGDVLEGLNASQRSAGANMSVDIATGDAFVRRSDGSYAHPVFNDAVYNQVIAAADGSNPRRDIVVLYVDYGQSPSTAVSNNTNGVVKIKVVNGTPAGSPTDPNDAAIQSSVGAGNPWTKICRVRVPAGQTSITNSLIDDLRFMATGISNAGWRAVSMSEAIAWVYSSFNSTTRIGVITVPTDATTRFSVGMWVRIVQATGGTKYGVITALTSTTISVNFFSTQTLNNEAILSPFYSSQNQPFGSPRLPVKSTDANGWTVWDYGTYHEWSKKGTITASTAGNGWSFYTLTTIPSMLSRLGTNIATTSMIPSDAAISLSPGGATNVTAMQVSAVNNYGNAVNNWQGFYQVLIRET